MDVKPQIRNTNLIVLLFHVYLDFKTVLVCTLL